MRGKRTVQAHQKGCCRRTGDSGCPEEGMVVRVEKRLTLKKNSEPKDIQASARLEEGGRPLSGMVTHHECRREGSAQDQSSETEIWGP